MLIRLGMRRRASHVAARSLTLLLPQRRSEQHAPDIGERTAPLSCNLNLREIEYSMLGVLVSRSGERHMLRCGA